MPNASGEILMLKASRMQRDLTPGFHGEENAGSDTVIIDEKTNRSRKSSDDLFSWCNHVAV